MPYFAQIGPNFEVVRVIVADDISWPQMRLGGVWDETKIADAEQNYGGIGMHNARNICDERYIHPWVKPTSAEDAYPNGAFVWHIDRAWRSLRDGNPDEPGVASWREYRVEYPQWVQPTGAHDAYQKGEKITFEGAHYSSAIDANVWSPTTYPAGWTAEVRK